MEKEFVPYEMALKLKELGFDEKCIGAYFMTGNNNVKFPSVWYENSTLKMGVKSCTAPLWQQAFDWFREEHRLYIQIHKHTSNTNQVTWMVDSLAGKYLSYHEARIESLKRLIEIVEKQKTETPC